MSSYALIVNGIVENILEWDGEGDLSVGDLVDVSGVVVGPEWLYDGSKFTNPNAAPTPTDSDLYEAELSIINAAYMIDTNNLSGEYGRVSLFDGVNEADKKSAIYARLQARNAQYASDIDALDQKYGG